MKKTSILAAAATSGIIASLLAPAAFAIPATISIKNHDLWLALRDKSTIITPSDAALPKSSFWPAGESAPSSPGTPAEYDFIVTDTFPTKIIFDCSEGDPLANITDFSDFNTFQMLEQVFVCAPGYEDKLPEGVSVINYSYSKTLRIQYQDTDGNTIDNDYVKVYEHEADHGPALTIDATDPKLTKNGYSFVAAVDAETSEIYRTGTIFDMQTDVSIIAIYTQEEDVTPFGDDIPEGVHCYAQPYPSCTQEGVTLHVGETTDAITPYIPAFFGDMEGLTGEWGSLLQDVATIDQDGRITGVSEGNSVIGYTIHDEDNNVVYVYQFGAIVEAAEESSQATDDTADTAEKTENPDTFDAGVLASVLLGAIALTATAAMARKASRR